jgi:hypothetical protein
MDNVLVILGVCGLALACLGVIVAALLIVGRAGGVLELFSLLNEGSKEDDGADYRFRRHRDLRTIAKRQDFDDAVAKNVIRRETGTMNSVSPSTSRLDAARRTSRTRRTGESDEYSSDEQFGGILDEDGSGTIDDDRL